MYGFDQLQKVESDSDEEIDELDKLLEELDP
jgi:hypothetical protein